MFELLTLLLSFILDVLFYKYIIIDVGKTIDAIIMMTIFAMPFVIGIMYYVAYGIMSIISLIFCGILSIFDINTEPYKSSAPVTSNPIKNDKKEEEPIDWATVARCDRLIEVCETLKGTELEYDIGINSLLSEIKMYKYTDCFSANVACNTLDFLLANDYRTTVARTDTGYRYLRSIGVIR